MPEREPAVDAPSTARPVGRLLPPDRDAILRTGVSEEEIDTRLADGTRPDDLIKEFTPERWTEKQLFRAKSQLKFSARRLFELGVPKAEIAEFANEVLDVVCVTTTDFDPFLNDDSIVCPLPYVWMDFQKACGIPPGAGPLGALILGGWQHSDEVKRERFEAQIEFAKQDRRNTERAVGFLRSLSDDDWYRGG